MTEFAAALNKQQQDEIAAMAGVAGIERIEALEKRLAKLEEQLAGIGTAFERAEAFEKAIWERPMMLSPEPATGSDPAA